MKTSVSLERLYISFWRVCFPCPRRVVRSIGNGGRARQGNAKGRNGKEERAYSERVAVIEGNFIILRHYLRYCNAIKLDTLRTPRKTAGISLNIPTGSLLLAPTSAGRGISVAASRIPRDNSIYSLINSVPTIFLWNNILLIDHSTHRLTRGC